ncbi:MAG: redox-sensing transcriptional repressor Rex [Kiritimatiellae bacterium]|nr:redox-sensing transcriptional repressor Rex [Kiritimatiellia bacterium]
MRTAERDIPAPVVQRLPEYLWFVRRQRDEGQQWVSSKRIARGLALSESTVRQDFSFLPISGRARRGYDVARLDDVLSAMLDVKTEKRMVIVGAGNLGRALAQQHHDFRRFGFRAFSLFDIEPGVIGQKIGRLAVRSMDRLAAYVQRESIDVGVVAVPPLAAQRVTDALVLAGVTGVVNFAPTRVVVPRKVRVVHAYLLSQFLVLSYWMGVSD